MWERMNREFNIGQNVRVNIASKESIQFNGKILGKANANSIVKMWIVSLDEPLNDYTKTIKEKAIVVQANFIN